MFVRYVNGRAYLAECVRIGGRVVQHHLGPADEDTIALVALLTAERDELRQERQQRRADDDEPEKVLADHWERVKREFEAAMCAAGYHNPKSRGWKKRRETNETAIQEATKADAGPDRSC
ncbi:MAG: hypothetical protein ACLP7Q_27075 [Isosphaeraceae bacterium]